MAYISAETKGLQELIQAFNDLPQELEKELEQALTEAAQAVFDKSLVKVNVNTGELKKSIKLKKAKKNNKEYLSSGVTFTNPKGVPVELGHRLISHGKVVGTVKQYPFLRPAFDEVKSEAENKIVDAFNRAIDNMGGMK